MIASRIGRYLMLAAGALCLLAAPLAVFGDDRSPATGVFMAAFALALLAVGGPRPPAPGAVDGVRSVPGGTAFDHAPGRTRAIVVGAVAFAVAGVALAIAGNVLLGTVVAIMFGAAGALGLRTLRRGGAVVLTPEAIIQRGGWGEAVVPWNAVADANLLSTRGTEMVGLQLGDRSGVVLPRFARVLGPLGRVLGGEVSIPLNVLACDPDRFADLVFHMLEHPEDRPQLADPGGPAVLQASVSS